jgi:hypothetical protein
VVAVEFRRIAAEDGSRLGLAAHREVRMQCYSADVLPMPMQPGPHRPHNLSGSCPDVQMSLPPHVPYTTASMLSGDECALVETSDGMGSSGCRWCVSSSPAVKMTMACVGMSDWHGPWIDDC